MRIRRTLAPAVAITTALILTACSAGTSEVQSSDSASGSPTEILAAYDLGDLSTTDLIDHLDSMPVDDRPTDFVASVRPSQLLVTAADGTESSLPIPDDLFYLSVAPYINDTHECHFHSLTTCLGEIGNQEVRVKIVDQESGGVVVDQALTTFDNGFVGVWLPKGINAEVTVEYDGLTGSQEISTRTEEDATCVTTLQLT